MLDIATPGPGRPRIALYGHDTRGLGHLRAQPGPRGVVRQRTGRAGGPWCASSADRLLAQRDGALEALAGCDGSDRAVLCHRDLHDGQLLVPADRRSPIGVLDWDKAAGASPALDLGNLLARLDLLAVRRPLTARAATDALLGAAAAADHPACTGDPAVLAAWRAAAAVRIAAVHAFR